MMPKATTDSKVKSTAIRRRREREARRQLILDSARAVFAERGFLNTSVDAIAERAELAVGTIYRYFQSKEELYVSLLFEAMAMFYERIEEISASAAPPDAQLRTIWQFFYDFYQEQPEYYRAFMFLHNAGLREAISSGVLDEINQRAAENFRLVARIVRAGVAAEIYQANLDAPGVVDVLWSALVGLVQLAETRRNLGVTRGNSLETLHHEAFTWIERGLRR